jgi:hypothetical protein
MIAGAVSPDVSFAEANSPDASSLSSSLAAPLDALKQAQDVYSKELGEVSAMPGGSLAPRYKAVKALEEIRSKVIEVRNSDKVPADLVKDALIAINEAETALLTDGAQTIAYSLGTVGLEIQAIEAKLSGQEPQTPMQIAAMTEPGQAPQQQAQQVRPEQPQQQPQQMAANEQKPQTEPAKPNAAEPAKPTTAETAQPSPAQNTIANRQRNEIVGKTLYDSAGAEVAKIQDVRTTADGKIAAVEIDLGGFLGIGSRRIPVPADQLELRGDSVHAKSLTQDQIKNLPHEAK